MNISYMREVLKNMKIENNKKIELSPIYDDNLNNPLDHNQMCANAYDIIKNIFTASTPNTKVKISNNNTVLTEKDIAELVFADNLDSNIKIEINKNLTDVWNQCLTDYSKGLKATQVFISQANATVKAPIASSTVIYIPSDLKDACKAYMKSGNDKELIVNSYFYLNIPHPIIYFKNNTVYNDYLDYLKNMVNSISVKLNTNVIQKFQSINSLNLKMIDGIALRKTNTDGCEPYSFERMLLKFTMSFIKANSDKCGIIVPNIHELLKPQYLIFMNVENIAKSSKNKVEHEKNLMKNALDVPISHISLSQISKLSSSVLQIRIINRKLKNHALLLNTKKPAAEKRNVFAFNKVNMTKERLSKNITKIINKEVNISTSENYSKIIKSSYMKPNRRNPDNYNLAGKSMSLQYKPDIHIYLDTSGSISEENYKNAILTCITMAKKLNINLYFNSFSHVISDSVKLHVKNKSLNEIYNEFQRVPKVTGGTNFSNVWRYILKSPKRKNEISLMITDFAYYPPDDKVDYPKKLYYAPIDISNEKWNYIADDAEEFCQLMYHIEPKIRTKILI